MGFKRPSGSGMAVKRPSGRLRFGCCAAPESAIPRRRQEEFFGLSERPRLRRFLPRRLRGRGEPRDPYAGRQKELAPEARLHRARALRTCPKCGLSQEATRDREDV